MLLDAGSTVYMVASMLGIKNDISVFTNAPKTAQILDDFKIKTYIVGRVSCAPTQMRLWGGWAVRAISEIKADVAILGTSGFLGSDGPRGRKFPGRRDKKKR